MRAGKPGDARFYASPTCLRFARTIAHTAVSAYSFLFAGAIFLATGIGKEFMPPRE
jgi:hypothetical protein